MLLTLTSLRWLRRILLIVVIAIAAIAVTTYWVLPVWLSLDTWRQPPKRTRLTPSDLSDLSVSCASGKQVSYFGYEFELPWSDIDETKTKLYPDMVVLTFRSGLILMFGVSPPKLWLNGLASGTKFSAKDVQAAYGTRSDYDFIRMLYDLTPDKMNLWALSPGVHYRDVYLLTMKSAAVLPWADDGFSRIRHEGYRGFQQGNPQVSPTIIVDLYSDSGGVHFSVFQKNYTGKRVSQAEINRMTGTLSRTSDAASSSVAVGARNCR